MVGRTLHNINVLISHIGTLGAIKNILCGKRAQQESLKWPNTCFNTELRYVILNPSFIILEKGTKRIQCSSQTTYSCAMRACKL